MIFLIKVAPIINRIKRAARENKRAIKMLCPVRIAKGLIIQKVMPAGAAPLHGKKFIKVDSIAGTRGNGHQ